MMCLDLSFVTGRNPSELTKPNAIALRYFAILVVSLRAYNLCLDGPISKLKCVFSSFLKGLSNDVFICEFCEG